MKLAITIPILCFTVACGAMPQGPDQAANLRAQGASTSIGTPTPSSDTNTLSQTPTGTTPVPARSTARQQGFQLQATAEPHLCIDSGNGTVPTMQPCSQAASQQWSYRHGTLAQGSTCLGSIGSTNNITMAPCDPNTTIQWEYVYGRFYVTDTTTSTCLSANPNVGSTLSTMQLSLGSVAPPQTQFLLAGSFTIEAGANPNKCWTVEGTPAIGSTVVLDDCNTTSGQQWSSLQSSLIMQGLCVAVPNSTALVNMPLTLEPCGGNSASYGVWVLFGLGHIQLYILAAANGVEATYTGLSNGSAIVAEPGGPASPVQNNDPNRLWFFGP